MIHKCELCGSEFLTEADPYVVRPTPTGVRLYCLCQIKGFEEMKGAEKLKEENNKLRDALKFYANRFSWTKSDHPTHDYYAGAIRNDDSLVEYTEADGDVFKDFCGGKLARQCLKELEEK